MTSSCKNQRRFYGGRGSCNRVEDWVGIQRTETGESTFHHGEQTGYLHGVVFWLDHKAHHEKQSKGGNIYHCSFAKYF